MDPRISCFIIVVISNSISKTNGFNSEVLKFTQATVDKVELGHVETSTTVWFGEVEERQKLCFYAAVKAKIPHIDYDSFPYWKSNVPLTEDDEYSYGMLCGGYPNFYVLRQETPGTAIQITFVQSSFDNYKFDNSGINSVMSVKLRDDLKRQFQGNAMGKLDSKERKSLCAAALKHTHIRLSFLNKSVERPQPYDFQYTNETETDVAILCRTSPRLYIRPGNSPTEVKLIVFKSEIDFYEFEDDEFETTMVSLTPMDERSKIVVDSFPQFTENDRMDLCTLARRGNVYSTFVVDEHVTEEEMSTFQYSGKQEDRSDFSILCTANPLLYLRFVGQNKIKRTFVQMPFDFHISGIQIMESISKKDQYKKTKEDQLKIVHHLFSNLVDETLWNVCLIAQKYVLESGKHNINFRFTEAEEALLPFKLLLSPEARRKYRPDVYTLRKQNGEGEEDVVYMCTRWPEMYIRLGKSKEEIEIMFLKDELSN